jgi:hypothetical protein
VSSVAQCVSVEQWCINSGSKFTLVTKCTVAPNICGSRVYHLIYATLLAPRILRNIVDFWKLCAPVLCILNPEEHLSVENTAVRSVTVLSTMVYPKYSGLAL